MQKYKIGQEEQNIRLDKIIATIDDSTSRTSVQRLIEEGKNKKSLRIKLCKEILLK